MVDDTRFGLPRGVAIVGAGAIGSLLGAALLRARVPVTLIGRAEMVAAVRAHGLRYEQPLHRATTLHDAEAVCDWSELSAFELRNIGLVVLTTKAFDTGPAAEEVARQVPAGVPLLVLQNGVGGVALARERIGARPLLAGATTLVATRPRPGTVRSHSRRGGLAVAAVTAPPELLQWAVHLLAASGLPVRAYADHAAMAWSKLLLNLLGNAVPAIVDRSPQQVFADLPLCRLEIAAFREALAVMRARGLAPVDLPGWRVRLAAWALGSLPLSILHRALPRLVADGRGGKEPSLQMDLRRGRTRSEVEYLNGAVVRAGLELGVPVPANALIYRTLALMAQGGIPRDAYAANPHSLLAPLR